MHEYNDKIIKGKSSLFLDEIQQSYINFECNSLVDKLSRFLEIAKSEAEMQYLFEANPALLPGLYDLHNGPLGNVIISKLQLANEFVTDFAFISINSAESQITLIEIESPIMQVFRESDDLFTSKFNLAIQQLRDWSLWAEQNSTFMKNLFRKIYFRDVFRYRKVVTRTILVAGRRGEIQQNPMREKRWSSINQSAGPIVMSYDRLKDIYKFNPRLLHELACKPANRVSGWIKARY